MGRQDIDVLREQFDSFDKDGEDSLPFAVGLLRTLNMKALGGRTPHEVVLGLKPTMPATLMARLPFTSIEIDE